MRTDSRRLDVLSLKLTWTPCCKSTPDMDVCRMSVAPEARQADSAMVWYLHLLIRVWLTRAQPLCRQQGQTCIDFTRKAIGLSVCFVILVVDALSWLKVLAVLQVLDGQLPQHDPTRHRPHCPTCACTSYAIVVLFLTSFWMRDAHPTSHTCAGGR